MSQQLFSLSNELLIEVISNLGPLDIYACHCTCRKLNELIANSPLIQYIMRTALSGVFDPLEPGISLPDRLDALERWETAWREIDVRKPIASIDALIDTVGEQPIDFVGEQHIIESHTGFGVPASYSFLNLHTWSSSAPNVARCTAIEVKDHSVLSFALSPELNLSVAFLASFFSDHQNHITITISPMWFSTGEPHPLASRPKLEVSVSRAAVDNLSEAVVIGDYILYWVGAPIISHTHEGSTLCTIYLVAWKGGWVSELRTSLPGVYGPLLTVLPEEIILLIRLREPALELCRLANIGDRGSASLETVCILSLPALTSRAFLQLAGSISEHPGHALFLKDQQHLPPHSYPLPSTSSGTGSSTRQPEAMVDDRRRDLSFVPRDGIISIVMHINALSGRHRMLDLIVRCRTLLEFTSAQAQVGAMGVAGRGVGTVLVLPWETWGPANSRILEPGPFSGALAGERRAIVLMSRITIRDFNPYRVRRTLALFGVAGREVLLACGSMVKVVKEASVSSGGECFCNDIETSLPYVETVIWYDGSQEVYMDENYLVVDVRTAADERKLILHSL